MCRLGNAAGLGCQGLPGVAREAQLGGALRPAYAIPFGSACHVWGCLCGTQEKGFQPYSLHLTWTYNGQGGKKARARQAMVWHDEDDYYASPLSYVTVDLNSIKVSEQARCGTAALR